MSDAMMWKLGGAALIVYGLKYILFGGTKTTGEFIELFGFKFGQGEREPMGTLACWFVGVVLMAVGMIVFHLGAKTT